MWTEKLNMSTVLLIGIIVILLSGISGLIVGSILTKVNPEVYSVFKFVKSEDKMNKEFPAIYKE